MLKFTPEPWYARESSGNQGLIISEANGATVAVAYDTKDAPLIAESPRMYAILDRLKEAYHSPLTDFAETVWHIAKDAETILNEMEG